MNVLLLQLYGPMQSWGTQSNFGIRDTGLEPSKSGVIGLLCAALGRPRTEPVADLAALQMGVRVDQEGRLTYDFHTAQRVYKASGGIKDTEISRRYYLADACFLVGWASDDLALLTTLHNALYDPVWPLSLGRKAFVPGEPIWLEDGLQTGVALLPALEDYRRLGNQPTMKAPEKLRYVLEDPAGTEVRRDQPISFQLGARRFASRRVTTRILDWERKNKESNDRENKENYNHVSIQTRAQPPEPPSTT